MSTRDDEPFFVGYLATPTRLRAFLTLVGLLLLIGVAGVGYAISVT